jgi:hypothetical protein
MPAGATPSGPSAPAPPRGGDDADGRAASGRPSWAAIGRSTREGATDEGLGVGEWGPLLPGDGTVLQAFG